MQTSQAREVSEDAAISVHKLALSRASPVLFRIFQ